MKGICIAVTNIPAAYSPAGVDTILALVSVDAGTSALMQCNAQVQVGATVSISFRESGMSQRLVPVAFPA